MGYMRLLIALLVLVSFNLHAQVRSVFKGRSATVMDGNQPLKKMNFGLSARQSDLIAALTLGNIDFGDVYYLEHPARRDFSGTPGYSGTFQPGVPPPIEPLTTGPGADLLQEQEEISEKPGDPEIAGQWWIEKLGVPQAWPLATGLGVTIADCDAGYFHEEADLHANMILEHRYDLSDRDDPTVVNDGPYATHGTSVAAIISGVMNGVGTNGIAYNSKIVPLQNYNYDRRDDIDKEEATAACVLRAIAAPNVQIVVLENQTANGSSETFVGTRDAVRLALQSGLIVVSAAGNYSAELLEEKKDNTGSIIVGAIRQDDTPAVWTNFGERITVAAYGEKLRTLSGPNGVFTDFGGTSGATPQVAAAVALMKEVNPMMTPEQARLFLLEARHVTPATGKVGGILKVHDAVLRAKETPPDIAAWSQQSLFREQLRSILTMP